LTAAYTEATATDVPVDSVTVAMSHS